MALDDIVDSRELEAELGIARNTLDSSLKRLRDSKKIKKSGKGHRIVISQIEKTLIELDAILEEKGGTKNE